MLSWILRVVSFLTDPDPSWLLSETDDRMTLDPDG